MTDARRPESPSFASSTEPFEASVAACSRDTLVAAALRLSYLTLACNGLIGASGLAVALVSGSLALAGLGLNALLDSSASAVLVWRFMHERRDPLAAERVERLAQAVVVAAMMIIGLYVGAEAVRALADRAHADESALGFVVATVSVLALPWLGRQKLRVAAALPSAALRGDAVLTLAAAALAAVTLLALFVTSTLGWWWADPVAALVIAIALVAEGVRGLVRHRLG